MPEDSQFIATKRDVLSVSRLVTEVRAVLEGSFPLLWLEGEISNLASPRSGHLYFSLKDAHSQVRCALFRNKRNLLRFTPKDGDKVLARVRVTLYEPRGDFQLVIEHMEPAGEGLLKQAFEALKAKLDKEGLFAAERKKDLPRYPACAGIITSPSGAAIRDVLHVLERRFPTMRVIIYPAQVQGEQAPAELRDALQRAIKRNECDVLILTRGGGSLEDLAAFNDEPLARAIADCPIPLVSAVGHEIDFTIADFVADRRAPTPSAAAELISPDRDNLLDQTKGATVRLRKSIDVQLQSLQQQSRHLKQRVQQQHPMALLRQQQQRLDEAWIQLQREMQQGLFLSRTKLQSLAQELKHQSPERKLNAMRERRLTLAKHLGNGMNHFLQQRRSTLANPAARLHGISPLATLTRGYSILRKTDTKQIIRSTENTGIGDQLTAILKEGELDVEVKGLRISEN